MLLGVRDVLTVLQMRRVELLLAVLFIVLEIFLTDLANTRCQ